MTKKLRKAISEIIAQFEKKYEVEVEEIDFNAVYLCADMYVSFNDIVFALEKDISFNTFYSWYWFNLENMKINLKTYSRRLQDMLPEWDIKDYHIFLLTEVVNKYEAS